MLNKRIVFLLTTAVICVLAVVLSLEAGLDFFAQAARTVGRPYQEAQAALERGQYEKAIKIMEKLLQKINKDEYLDLMCRSSRIKPDKEDIELLLGAARECRKDMENVKEYFRLGNFAAAKKILERLTLVSPKSNKIKASLRRATKKLRYSPNAQY